MRKVIYTFKDGSETGSHAEMLKMAEAKHEKAQIKLVKVTSLEEANK